MENNSHNNSQRVDATISAYRNEDRIKSDPEGSYTGTPEDKYSEPEQDADDL